MAEACAICGSHGGWDLQVAPSRYRRQGRMNQGAMSPQWCLPDYSQLYDAVLCLECWRDRFWGRAA